MSLQVIREQSIHYGDTGRIGSVEETYVKLSVSFAQLLQTFKGARLSAFLCLALNEAEISFGRSVGMSIYDIAEKSGYDERTVLRSMQYLCKFNYADSVSERGEHGETLYRVRGYAWFGNPKSAPTPASNRCDKMSYRSRNVTPGVTKSPSSSSDIQSSKDLHETTTNSDAATKILQAANVRTCDLDLSVFDEERAHAIADYIAENPDQRRSPAGFVYVCLKANPYWNPPVVKSEKKSWSDRYDHLVKR
jgi:hypothetical protein